MAYLTGRMPQPRLFVRRLDDVAATIVHIADGAYGPFFSPDGKWIAYATPDAKLMKAQVSGDTAPQPIADVLAFRGGVWLPDDTIVFSPNTSSGLMRVSASGGTPTAVTALSKQRDDKTHRFPDALPDGRHIIFTTGNHDVSSYEDGSIVMAAIDGGEEKVLVEHAMFGRYIPGYLLFSRGTSIYAVPFDATRGAVTGPSFSVLPGVLTHPTFAYADYAVSQNGVIVYSPGGRFDDLRRLVWVDRRGNSQPAYSDAMPFNSARLSPDGRHLLIEIGAANNAIWTVDLGRNVRTRLTFHGDAYFGRWSPDGTRIAYMSGTAIHLVAADGSGRDDVLVDAPGDAALVPTGWSPDGRILAYQEFQPNRQSDIKLLDVNSRKSSDFLTSSFSEMAAQFSPDGRWLAYVSNESGRNEVYLRPFGRAGGRWQISRDGADQFAWNPKGGEILYRSGNALFSVPVRLTESPAIAVPVHLFDSPSIGSSLGPFGFGLSADGARILLQDSVPVPAVHTLAVITDWFDALRK
jgi:Tol biopolymer transport system component